MPTTVIMVEEYKSFSVQQPKGERVGLSVSDNRKCRAFALKALFGSALTVLLGYNLARENHS